MTKAERKTFTRISGWVIKSVFDSTMVIIGTISALATPMFFRKLKRVDVILHDEAGASDEADAAVAMSFDSDRYIEAGDHKQMGPLCTSVESNEYVNTMSGPGFARRRIT